MQGTLTTTGTLPQHVAIIMDGNGRWAKARGLPRTAGHRKGIEAVRRTVEAARELGIPYLTMFGFSSENWRRPEGEVFDLMQLLRFYLRSEIAELHKNGVRLRVIGDRSRLSGDIVTMIENAEELTRGNRELNLTIALSYGARQEIANAARQMVREALAGRLDPEDVTEESFSGRLLTRDIPDPDLLLRTSGEQRISNFLLWQLAYTELVFVDTLWPDFTKRDLEDAIREFNQRDRRYGAVGTR
ncbi:isoprenyl transferase [Skermanella mucosa]|uniref:isoprenyl transferase n=1 Tax=Skermanella mucosa TaxID=1789672 RepID=UPI00192BD4A5|nr:isoprenyl transferase [Skermanella mucosa]